MQDAMDDDTVEFIIVFLAELLGIRADCVQTDDEITADNVAFVVVKRNDIRVVIMAEIVVVDLEYCLLYTSDAADEL